MGGRIFLNLIVLVCGTGFLSIGNSQCIESKTILCYASDGNTVSIRIYWKDERGVPFKNIAKLKGHLETWKERLVFAMNGGMFKKDFSPQGLFIANGRTFSPLDTSDGAGNFYLKPNGVFYVSFDGKAEVVPTERFPGKKRVRFATQSGPMLLEKGKMPSIWTDMYPRLIGRKRNGSSLMESSG